MTLCSVYDAVLYIWHCVLYMTLRSVYGTVSCIQLLSNDPDFTLPARVLFNVGLFVFVVYSCTSLYLQCRPAQE